MGLISKGSGNKKYYTTTNTSQNAGFSEVDGNALALQGDGNVIEMLDNGAIEQAFGFADRALESVDSISDNARATTSSAIASVTESSRQETENLVINGMKYLFYAAVAFGIVKVFQTWGGKKQ